MLFKAFRNSLLHCPTPKCFFSDYDFVFLLRAALVHAVNYQITYKHGDLTYTRPLLEKNPDVLFKNEETPLSITLKFRCPYFSCSCQLNARERHERREKGVKLDECPFKRRVVLRDTIGHIQAPLSDIIDNMHTAVQKESIPLDVAFSASKTFCDSRGFTETQFQQFISQKIPMPFEFCTSYEKLVNQTVPPKREDFRSTLRGIDAIPEDEYQVFTDMWHTLNVKSLWDFMMIYNIAGILLSFDACNCCVYLFYTNIIYNSFQTFVFMGTP